MARFSNRFLHLDEAPVDVDDCRLFRMEGVECLSEPFSFDLTVRSQGEVPPADAWIGASISFSFGSVDGSERKVNGRCASFRHLYQKDRYTEFMLRITPAFDALKLTTDRRIFNNQSGKQVIEAILGEHRISFDDSNYGSSARKAYIVQHDESDFDLVSRLMEDEGVFYYFRYDEAAAPFKHRMVLAGSPSGYYDGDPFDLAFRRDHLERGLSDLRMEYQGAPAKVVTHDYNFRQPGELTPVTSPSKVAWAEKSGQVFHYAAGYQDAGAGQGRADLRAQGTESGAVTMHGEGSYAAFAPGARFNVPDQRLQPVERRIVVHCVNHSAFDPYAGDEGQPFYHQRFRAHPSAQTYRPPTATPKPQPGGPQTAVVLDQNDPEGLGRVKVRFHWDHSGHSTCWVRVLQQWAGDLSTGAQWVPRPGAEVLVGFIENRVDLPYLMGCFYNGKQKPVFDLPANLTQSGWRTNGPGGKAHHLLFEDKAGKEGIDLASGWDFTREIAHDETATITNAQVVNARTITLNATDRITLIVKGSEIVITGDGIWLNGGKINLNGDRAPPPPRA
ncbi:type VI secretion system Vgr family protein [Sphingomonas bacterium]|uniref:type VI secretion system Vgr family protein n=1 Tax=Sphingomonas bacterium TaxID=1895847 RepID=UPI0015773033|nr:type VI secretion system tip protein TssI/VgrG [Sphingomonas bacterium]